MEKIYQNKKTVLILTIIMSLLLISCRALAATDLAERLNGHILLQVENKGEAWYVNPEDSKRYYLGKPADAFQIMRQFGIGITNSDLQKIAVGLIDYDSQDSDWDGLPDALENALDTDSQKADTDNDGYDDKTEALNGYNPNGNGKIPLDQNFARAHAGKIFLQVENKGEAWYVNPENSKRYFLGRPNDAFQIMRELSLGITNSDLGQINIGVLNNSIEPTGNNYSTNNTPNNQISTPINNEEDVIYQAADAIRHGDIEAAKSYFTDNMQAAIEYVINVFDESNQLLLGNILSGSKLSSQTDTQKIYTNEVYFSLGGNKIPVQFIEEKQADETWKLTNL